MKHIFITDKLQEKAKLFRKQLERGLRGNYNSPMQMLSALWNDLPDGSDEERYVELIQQKWQDLIIAEPSAFDGIIEEFEQIISGDEIKDRRVQMPVRNKETGAIEKYEDKRFYPLIVDAMRYDYVQSTIYPTFMRELGIRSCVYCNAQYAFSVAGHGGYQNYELDHYKPKSIYPYLCTTFMNLQPSCSACNRKKSNKLPKDDEELFQLFVRKEDVRSESPVAFELNSASLATYMADPKHESLKIDFSCPGNPKLEKGFNEFFKISTLYQAHTDVAEELIWKSRIYNRVVVEDYKRLFKQLGFRDSDFKRFILGNYDTVENIHKRPLSKMTQDIAKQLHIL